ncbi:hypothetical protein BO71DRAFT_396613 [Aspergillus ellipticus CBS 707.79]|uniref:Uncharacterized protein n=1 Tax=Aspergillus ellipticus CBS 707.79 TaxID=1448320 RepID=A0A319DHI0_9EURO|nr:hypothetical protein BO71DRAFT_396613 [Aspergillus ellipticus CBS 707.79]
MQLKTIFAVFAAASLATATPVPEGEDEIAVVKRGGGISFQCKGAVVQGVAGTKCGTTWAQGCSNLECKNGHYVAFPAPNSWSWNSYIVCF